MCILKGFTRDQAEFTDNHPDIIQTRGGVGELRIDHLTGSTDYQGLYFKNDGDTVYQLGAPAHGPVIPNHINLVG